MSGSAAATLAVEDSIFQANALQIPPGTLEANVLLYTGNDGVPDIANPDGYFIPVWRVDDGPVYGLPFEMCQVARQHSLTAVQRGFEPSWPSGSAAQSCANVTHYGPLATYSQVITLTEGAHTLFVGTVPQVSPLATKSRLADTDFCVARHRTT